MTSKARVIDPSERCPREMLRPACAASVSETCGSACSERTKWLRVFEGLARPDVEPSEVTTKPSPQTQQLLGIFRGTAQR